jgi:hypothetical protein
MFRRVLETARRFRCQKTITQIHVVSAILAVVVLSVATVISTLLLPGVQRNLEEQDSLIAGRRYRVTQDLVQGLYAMDLQTERRVDFLDQRLESVIVSNRSQRTLQLAQDAAEKTKEQISLWDSLFRNSPAEGTNVNPSTLDPRAPHDRNAGELESALVAAKRDAYSRLGQTLEEIRTQELQKNKCENRRNTREAWFGFTQVIGLMMVVVSGILDAWGKQKEATVSAVGK